MNGHVSDRYSIVLPSSVVGRNQLGNPGQMHRGNSLLVRIVLPVLLVASACSTTSPVNVDTFTRSGVMSGSTMTEEACVWPDSSVWVVVDGQGECIRYFAAGVEESNGLAVVFFHGDRLKHHWDRTGRTTSVEVIVYSDNNESWLRSKSGGYSLVTESMYIYFSRPGVYGSSGDHKQRRRPREIAVINAALDSIKRKHSIQKFAIAGQSGGGHVVASLLTMRDDIECAVSTSGIVAVGMRVQLKGWRRDATGYSDYFDPVEHVDDILRDPDRRIFIVGDPDDSNVPFPTQRAYYEKVKQAGHDAWLVKSFAYGSQRHRLGHVAREIVGYCAKGMPTEEILERTHIESL